MERGKAVDSFLKDDDEASMGSTSTNDLLEKPKDKRKRLSAAELRKKEGDEAISRDDSLEDRLSDEEITQGPTYKPTFSTAIFPALYLSPNGNENIASCCRSVVVLLSGKASATALSLTRQRPPRHGG